MSKSAILSEDVEFKGTLSFNAPLEINGRFEGEIIADATLTIGENAVIKGNIEASSVVTVRGKVQGNISSKERVDVANRAQLFGDVVSPRLTLADGATFVGSSKTSEKPAVPSEFANIFTRLDKPKAQPAPVSVTDSSAPLA